MKFQIKIQKNRQTLVEIDHFSFESGKINFLFGESGIGKSLSSRAVFGLLDPAEFEVVINNLQYEFYLETELTREFRKEGFFVFQEPSTHLNPLIRLKWQLQEGDLARPAAQNEILQSLWPGNSDYRRLLDIFPKPFRPSGGEKQRFLLAMAFKKINLFLESDSDSSPIFIFDEPTGNLDDSLRDLFILLLFEKYRQKKFTVLFITHDYSIIGSIEKKFKNLKKQIVFNELRKDGSQQSLDTFRARSYLDWLNSVEKLQSASTRSLESVVELQQDIDLKNRRLTIFSDSLRKKPSDLKIHGGEIVYVKAGSGVGKTTLAKVIMGLFPAKNFKVRIKDLQITTKSNPAIWRKSIWGKRATMVFQHADEALNLNATVLQTIKSIPKAVRPADREVIAALKRFFTEIDFRELLKKKVKHLSGGQKQRLNLLRAFLIDSPFVILDEPLNGLDFNSIKLIVELMREMKNKGTAFLLISHNEEIFDTLITPPYRYYISTDKT